MIAIHPRWSRHAKRLNRQGQVQPSPDEPRSAATRTPSHGQMRPSSSPATSKQPGILSLLNHARNGRGLRSYRCAVTDQVSIRIFGDMTAETRAEGCVPCECEASVCGEIEADVES